MPASREDPINWSVQWRYNAKRFPLLGAVTARYLSASAFGVLSERLFGTARDACRNKRTLKTLQFVLLNTNMV